MVTLDPINNVAVSEPGSTLRRFGTSKLQFLTLITREMAIDREGDGWRTSYVHGRVYGELAICGTADSGRVVGIPDREGAVFELSVEELVEVLVFLSCPVRNYPFLGL